MKTLLYDLETDNLLDKVTKVHCCVIADVKTGEIRAYHDDLTITPRYGTLEEGYAYLGTADRTSGHNILEYDSEVLKKLGNPAPVITDRTRMVDTLVLSRLVYSDRKERDFALFKKERLSGKNVGQHSLGAWGERLGEPKGDFSKDFSTFTQAMLDYCIQDVTVNLKLYRVLTKQLPHFKSRDGLATWQVEHLFAGQLFDQQQRGVRLDRKVGQALADELAIRKGELEDLIQEAFPPRKQMYAINKKTGKQTFRHCDQRNGKYDHKMVPFEPNSRAQLAARLQQKHSWVPRELTAKGNPVMQERVLVDLGDVYPEVKAVAEYYIVNARLSILRESKNSYFSLMDEHGLLHGRTLHIGAGTHRCSHSKPNVGNVTSTRKPYGKRMRSIFIPYRGDEPGIEPGEYEQAGYDADALELCMQAHYLAKWDGGAYGKVVKEGNKEEGTDAHSLNAAVISTIVPCTRTHGKNTIYALNYGAADLKLGKMHGGGKQLGAQIRKALSEGTPGMKELNAWLAGLLDDGGNIISLDGRRIGIRHNHTALNTLLQGGGAVVMKWVPVVLEQILPRYGIVPGRDYYQTGHIHDECQGSLRKGLRDPFRAAVSQAFATVSEVLDLRVPVSGTADFGASWLDTH